MSAVRKKIITNYIIISFGFLIALLLGGGFYFHSEIQTLSTLTHSMFHHPLTVSNTSLQCSATITKMHRSMKDIVLFPETAIIVENIKIIDQLEKEVFQNLELIQEKILGDQGKAISVQARDLFVKWKPIRDEVIFRAVNKEFKKAALVTREKGARHVEKMEAKMLELNQYAKNKAANFLKQSEQTDRKIKSMTLSFIVLAIISVIVIGLVTITITLKAENELIQSERRHRIIFDNSPFGMVRVSSSGIIIDLNDNFSRLLGYPKEQLIGFNTLKNSSTEMQQAMLRALRGKTAIYEDEYTSVTENKTIDIRVVYNPVLPGEDSTEVIATVEDITERKKSRKILEENETRLNTILKSAQSGIMIVDELTRKIIDINPAAARMIKDLPRNIIGRTCHEFVCPNLEGECPVIDGGKEVDNAEKILLTTGGQQIPILKTVTKILINSKPCLLECFVDISQQKQIEEKLTQAKEAAEDAARSKAAFLANMSHEIRTPMNGVIGMTELLAGTQLNTEQQNYVSTIQTSGDSLLAIINDILDYSKIEAGKVELDSIKFNLRTLLEDVADLCALRAHERDLEYCTILHPSLPDFLMGDPGRMRQILVNLVGNAIKFTHTGEIVVSVKVIKESKSNVTVRFNVADTGIGIPENKISVLFESFSQADTSTTRKYGGTGLGLTISRELTKLMDGEIGLESQEGKGSTFWFTAVMEKVAHAFEEEKITKQDIKGKHILIVDDNKTNRFILKEDLKQWGCRFEEAENGMIALEKLQSASDRDDLFDIAIIDMQMPHMDGETLGKKIKEIPGFRKTSLVMLTSIGARGDINRLKEIGFAAYLHKPIKQASLYDCLASVHHVDQIGDPETPKKIITRHTIAENKKTGAKVLLAEDNFINQKVALGALKKLGMRTDAVANGKEAIEALEKQSYDIVLMDCQMPEMDGYQATGIIRDSTSNVLNHDIPIIAMTANAMREDKEKCLRAGMSDYLAKPVKQKNLSKMLVKWLSC